jgi:hypothetical protein
MNPTYTFNWWTRVAAINIGVMLVPTVVFAKAPRIKKGQGDLKSAVKLVDAIVNRNMAPKIVEWPGRFSSSAALFPEDYDWKEDNRASNAIGRLKRDRTEAVWEEMVRRHIDRRYSETVTSGMTGDAFIKHVGSICGQLAHARLIGAYWRHLPLKNGKRLKLEIGIGDLSTWRKQRADKALYELQIEVCEKAIEALDKVEPVPQTQKDRARKKIEAEIAKLKKTKKPTHVLGTHGFDYGRPYNAKLAKRVREGVRTGKYPDLGIAHK